MSELMRESVIEEIDAKGTHGTASRKDSDVNGLAQAYVRGEIDIPEVARLLGDGWDGARVAAEFESMGMYRPFVIPSLLSDDMRSILSRIPNVQDGSMNDEFDSEELIKREVIASQRIEGIHATGHSSVV